MVRLGIADAEAFVRVGADEERDLDVLALADELAWISREEFAVDEGVPCERLLSAVEIVLRDGAEAAQLVAGGPASCSTSKVLVGDCVIGQVVNLAKLDTLPAEYP